MNRSHIWHATILLVVLEGVASALVPVGLDDHQGEYRLGNRLEIFEDASARLTFDQVQTQPFMASPRSVPNFGLTGSAYWVRFVLRNESAAVEDWRLEVAWPVIDSVTAFLPDDLGRVQAQHAGDHLPFATWELAYRNPTFRLRLQPGSERTIYMRFAGEDTMLLPITLWSAAAFEQNLSAARDSWRSSVIPLASARCNGTPRWWWYR